MATTTDEQAMERALTLATRARRVAPPNPWVGCVLVGADGSVVGQGSTRAPGGAHAEIVALEEAGSGARGSTAFVTLEPCDHHGRTPPCTEALIAAGVARVVVAVEDPDPQVAGRGIARLRDAGIGVEVGLGAAASAALLAPYLHQRRTGRAFALIKTAASLDGRTAAADGTSQWITGPEARADAHGIRAESQAVIVGSGTALADRPSLTARDCDPPAERQPRRVLLDARGRVPAVGPLFDPALGSPLVFTTAAAPAERIAEWQAVGAEVESVDPQDGGVHLEQVLVALAERHGVVQALVEGGAALHGALLDHGLADRIVAYVAPVLLGRDARPAFDVAGPATLADAARWRIVDTTPCGADVRITLDPIAAPEVA
ncbi:MAG: bifunctional diaminohydroxyphosphoribosylaminopyrimidine deaminase/5-amino-6-(5-phosphoribosylamino)uracil reductase RibD [Actinomycetes bacterium]